MRTLNVALIGYNFMGKAHSHALDNVSFFFKNGWKPVKKVIVGRTEHLVKQAAADFGWEAYETDWRKVVQRSDIDVVLIASATASHYEIAAQAAAAGKHILCEKPLGLNAEEAKLMLEQAQSAGIVHMLGHNYRRVPAIGLARKLIADGEIGDILHFRGAYLQDWLLDPLFPASWKLDKAVAGSGPHGDLNSHLIDLARYLVGEIDQVVGMDKTFVAKRPKVLTDESLGSNLKAHGDTHELADVTVEDTSAFLAKFENGALGTFEASRMAGGRKNDLRIEVNGTVGSICFRFERMNELEFWSKDEARETQGFRKILVTEDVHPYIGAWWPPGHIIGYQNTFVNQLADFLHAIQYQENTAPDFHDGWLNALVLDAVLKSVQTRSWEKVKVDE